MAAAVGAAVGPEAPFAPVSLESGPAPAPPAAASDAMRPQAGMGAPLLDLTSEELERFKNAQLATVAYLND